MKLKALLFSVVGATLGCGVGVETVTSESPGESSEAAIGTNIAPGTYSDWALPAGEYYNVDINVTVEVDPGADKPFFFTHQFGIAGGNGGYIGLQDNPTGKMVIFSIWDSWGATAGSAGSWCQTFGGEGVGHSCRIKYNWVAGRSYRLRVWNLGGGKFGGWVRDNSTGVETMLGTISGPGAWRALNANSVSWIEYYGYLGSCIDLPWARARFSAPTGNSGSRVATNPSNHVRADAYCKNALSLGDRGSAVQAMGGPKASRKVALQANSGHFVAAEWGGGGAVNANRTAANAWETFGIVDLGGGKVALRAHNGLHLSAVGAGGGAVNAGAPWVLGWETFTLENHGSQVALRTADGHYLVAEFGGGYFVQANRTGVGAWERFTLVPK